MFGYNSLSVCEDIRTINEKIFFKKWENENKFKDFIFLDPFEIVNVNQLHVSR